MRRLAIAVVLVAGCVTMTPYRPVTAKAPSGVTSEDLYAAAVQVFMDGPYGGLRDKDAAAGMVAAGWVELELIDPINDTRLLHAWRVTIDGDDVRVSIDCGTKKRTPGVALESPVTPCGTTDRRKPTFAADANNVAQAIIHEAKRRAAKRQQQAAPAPAATQPTAAAQ